MAHAAFEAPPPPPPPDLLLRLSAEEAGVLALVLKMVGGNKDGARSHIDAISVALARAGVRDPERLQVTGTLMLNEIGTF